MTHARLYLNQTRDGVPNEPNGTITKPKWGRVRLCLHLEILVWRMTSLSGTDEDELSTSYAEYSKHKTRCPRSGALAARQVKAKQEGFRRTWIINDFSFLSVRSDWSRQIDGKRARSLVSTREHAAEDSGVGNGNN